MKLLALVVVVAFLGRVMARPEGAPVQACITLTPQHGSNTPRPNPSSNTINIEAFEVEGSSNATADYVYIPGSSYTITITSTGTFRGFFIQARLLDGTVVGEFSNLPANSRLSSCTPPNGGVTHVNTNPVRIEFNNLTFTWTAPSDGTNAIRFHYTTVREFTIFWVNETTPFIEAGMSTGAASTTVVSVWSTALIGLAVALKNIM